MMIVGKHLRKNNEVISKEKQRLKTTWVQADDQQASEVLGAKLNHEYNLETLVEKT